MQTLEEVCQNRRGETRDKREQREMSHPIKIPTGNAHPDHPDSDDDHDHDGNHDDNHDLDNDNDNMYLMGQPVTYLEGTLNDVDNLSSSTSGRSPALTMSGGLAASLSELNGSLSALDEGLEALRRRGSSDRNFVGQDSDSYNQSSGGNGSGEIPVGSLPDNRLERRRQLLASGEGGSAGAAISGVASGAAAARRRNKRVDAPFGGTGTSRTNMPTMAYSYTGGGRGLPSRRRTPPLAPALHARLDTSNRLARMPQMSLPESALDHHHHADPFGPGGAGGGASSVPVTTAYGSLNDCSFQKYARSRMMQHGSTRMRAAQQQQMQQMHHFRRGGGSPIIEGAEHEFGNNSGGGGGTGGGGTGGGKTNAIGGPVAGGIGGEIGAASLPPDYHSDLVRKRWEDATAGNAAAGGGGGSTSNSNKPSPLVLGGGIEIGAAPSPLNPGKRQSSLSAQLNDLALVPSAAGVAASSTSGEAGTSGLAGALDLGLGASASTESPVGGGGGAGAGGADYGSAGLGRHDSDSLGGRPRGDGSFSDNSYGGGANGGGGDGPASVTSLTALEILSSSRQSLERRLGSPVGGGAGVAASSGLSPGAAAANFDTAMGDQQQQHPAGGVAAHFLPDQPNLHHQQQLPDVVPFEYSENPPAEKDHLTDDEGAFDLDM